MINLLGAARKPRAARDRLWRSIPSETFRRRGGPAPSARDPAAARCGPQKVRRQWRVWRSAAAHLPRGFRTIPGRARKPARLHRSSAAPGPAPRKIPRGRGRATGSPSPSLAFAGSSFLRAWPSRIFSLFLVSPAASFRAPSHALSNEWAMPLPRAAPLPATIRGGSSRVVRGSAQVDQRVPGGDFPRRTYPENAGPSRCGPASRAIAPQLRARAPRVLLDDRALELFKLYAIAPLAARGITFCARKRKGPGRNIPGPFVGCLLSLPGGFSEADQ